MSTCALERERERGGGEGGGGREGERERGGEREREFLIVGSSSFHMCAPFTAMEFS